MTQRIVEPWWGEFQIDNGQTGCWQVGPLSLWIQHQEREWRIAHESSGDAFLEQVRIDLPCGAGMPGAAPGLTRYGFREPGNRVRILPRSADRPVISRPEKPLFIPPGEELTLYVSSPLWVGVQAGAGTTLLQEFPVFRPSDTWFGSPTQEGGLSYAATTRALNTLEGFPHSPFRAVTPLLIRNLAKDLLPLERLNLPVPFLSLFQAPNGSLWTQAVSLEREEEGEELAMLKLGRGAPPEAGGGAQVSEPRKQAERNLVFQAFSKLFG